MLSGGVGLAIWVRVRVRVRVRIVKDPLLGGGGLKARPCLSSGIWYLVAGYASILNTRNVTSTATYIY